MLLKGLAQEASVIHLESRTREQIRTGAFGAEEEGRRVRLISLDPVEVGCRSTGTRPLWGYPRMEVNRTSSLPLSLMVLSGILPSFVFPYMRRAVGDWVFPPEPLIGGRVGGFP